MAVTREQLKKLSKRIPYKFKPQAVKYGKATIVSYIDARDAQDVLDQEIGPENWQVQYFKLGDQMFANIGIKVQYPDGKEEWVWKADGGKESFAEKEKGLISDCFKRACVAWSIGRFLYSTKIIELKAAKHKNGKEYPVTNQGKILWNTDQLTEYIRKNNLDKQEKSKYTTKEYTQETIERVKKLEYNNKKGKEILEENLDKFNKVSKKNFSSLSEMTDKDINNLIDFIEKSPPDGI